MVEQQDASDVAESVEATEAIDTSLDIRVDLFLVRNITDRRGDVGALLSQSFAVAARPSLSRSTR
jgi:hypothetical protein